MFKKIMSAVLTIGMICSCSSIVLGDNNPLNLTVSAKEKGVTDYTYAVTPVLSPFNEYFYVKTDNPDPFSFRFVDNSTVYGEKGASGSLNLLYDSWNEKMINFSDVVYENKSTSRVKGGYIFEGDNTDGGYVTLQYKKEISYSEYNQLKKKGDDANIGEIEETLSSSQNGGISSKSYRIIGYYKWINSSIKIKLPKLVDDVDYLVNTYAKKNNFFDNMNAVQSGLSSICLYSGSFIRGELYKSNSYWSLSTSPHNDQTFYLQSPYSRKENNSLFATTIYPFRYDSLGFPSMMAEVSQRLDSSSTYKWDEYSHSDIYVTYKGETHEYGGQGNGIGQGITADKIKQYFSFGNDGTIITLKNAKKLLEDYSTIKMSDDVPRQNALTWEKVCNTVGDGSWVRLIDLYSIIGSSQNGYTYLYKKNDGKSHWTDSAGSSGAEIYWGGDLGFLTDAWVDGRYISVREGFVRGAKFEDHPTSDIMFTSITIPEISYDNTYKYNSTTDEYEKGYSNIKINNNNKKNVLFNYDNNVWKATFDSGYASYSVIADMVEKGVIDKKYLDMITLTLDEVKALKVDKNTNTVPLKGYIYDGTAEPGTPFKMVFLTDSNVSVTLSSSRFTYNGNVQVPKITVKYKGKTLKENTDYTLTYSNQSSKTIGRYTVKAEGMGNYTGTVQKTYLIVPPDPKSVSLNKTVMSLGKNETTKLTATVAPSNATNKSVTWRTSDSKVLTVDKKGNVKAVGNGTAWITAKTVNGKEKSCKITVKNAPNKVTISKGVVTIGVGEKFTVGSAVPDGSAAAKRTYRTSNSSIVKMTRTDWQGDFVGVKPGVAYVTVRTYNGKESTCKVTVKAAPKSVTISKKALTMKVGQTATLSCSVPSNAGCAARTFRTSNSSVVKMTKTSWTGTFKALKKGTAYVTVRTYNGKESSCKITVE